MLDMYVHCTYKRVVQHKTWLSFFQNDVTGWEIMSMCLWCNIFVTCSNMINWLLYHMKYTNIVLLKKYLHVGHTELLFGMHIDNETYRIY